MCRPGTRSCGCSNRMERWASSTVTTRL
jgi:hypothetical protein